MRKFFKSIFYWFKRVFVWWQDATIGTYLNTALRGKKVGQDDQGNTYYQTKDGVRRWVIYNGTVEASRVPAEWHGWLHKTQDEPPTVNPSKIHPWEKPHQPNQTGSKGAYYGSGTPTQGNATGDYEAWKP